MLNKGGEKKSRWKELLPAGNLRLLAGMAFSLVVVVVLLTAVGPSGKRGRSTTLSQALLDGKQEVDLDSDSLAGRVLEQKFQVHMEEMEQQPGEIPYVEVWVLNDPFYPLMGDVGSLRSDSGDLSSKEWQMLGFPNYEEEEGGGSVSTAPAPSTPPSSLPVTTGVEQRVVMVEDIYEIRGIRYATIKVNNQVYDKLKAGSEFAEIFKVVEIKDEETVSVLCGDETYDLKLQQLRKL